MENPIKKTLSIVIPVTRNDDNDDILETIRSTPWIPEVSIVIYTDDSNRIYKILEENDFGINPESLGDSDLMICEITGESKGFMKNVGIIDLDSDYVTFLSPGNEITRFNPEILEDKFIISLGAINDEIGEVSSIMDYPEKFGMLPLWSEGIIYSTSFLKNNEIRFPEDNEDDDSLFIADTHYKSILKSGIVSDSYDYYEVSVPTNKDLSLEIKLIKDLQEFWNTIKDSFKDPCEEELMSTLIWSRISRSAARIISERGGKKPESLKNYYKYLFLDNRNQILGCQE